MLMYHSICLCPNLVSVHLIYAISILHFKFQFFFIYLLYYNVCWYVIKYIPVLYACMYCELSHSKSISIQTLAIPLQ